MNDKLRNFYIIIYIVNRNPVMRADRQNIAVRRRKSEADVGLLSIQDGAVCDNS